jgi:hypothetical protein
MNIKNVEKRIFVGNRYEQRNVVDIFPLLLDKNYQKGITGHVFHKKYKVSEATMNAKLVEMYKKAMAKVEEYLFKEMSVDFGPFILSLQKRHTSKEKLCVRNNFEYYIQVDVKNEDRIPNRKGLRYEVSLTYQQKLRLKEYLDKGYYKNL